MSAIIWLMCMSPWDQAVTSAKDTSLQGGELPRMTHSPRVVVDEFPKEVVVEAFTKVVVFPNEVVVVVVAFVRGRTKTALSCNLAQIAWIRFILGCLSGYIDSIRNN